MVEPVMGARKPWRERFNPHWNPKLNPLLAVGIGLGFVALFLPAGGTPKEQHSDAEILARLRANRIDPDHGPLFWLAEQRQATPLYTQALAQCSHSIVRLQPSCLAILRLEALAQPTPTTSAPEFELPTPPPTPEEPR